MHYSLCAFRALLRPETKNSDQEHQTRVPEATTSSGKATPPRLRLRLLETSDVHANLLPFDYFADRGDQPYGLARVATLIREARIEAANTLLFDNGDFLQGTPISDLTAQPGRGWTGPHPVITAMNALGYDAATLGNHEFNFGLNWLHSSLTSANFPVVCANALTRPGATPLQDETLLPPCVMLKRQYRDSSGQIHALKIGVIGLVPPQITTWDQFHLQNRLTSRDMIETARAHVPALRARGAELIVALAHTGIAPGPARPNMENAALQLGAIGGIDAILAGHTHQVFPQPGGPKAPGIDHTAATLNGTPAVMAGFRGSHLGVLDLTLTKRNGRWQVTHHRAEARAVTPPGATAPVPADPGLCQTVQNTHNQTRQIAAKPLGRTKTALHSYLALLRCDPSVRLVTEAQRRAVQNQLQSTPHQHLAILSASAPFKTGGRGGPHYYTDIPAGPLTLRNAADLYPFPNTLCALRLTGAELLDWLERAASTFNRIVPGKEDQPLCNPATPGHAFDVIQGLSYRIDLAPPARFDASGTLAAPSARRIRDLAHKGQPLDPHAEFILATNNYRAFGGGPYPAWPQDRIVLASQRQVRDIVADHIRHNGTTGADTPPIWSFIPIPGASVSFETGPGIRAHHEELDQLGLTDLGETATGFTRLRMALTGHRTPCESAL